MTSGMPVEAASTPHHSTERDATLRCVTVIAGVVVALTFMFGFGNVLSLALRLGVSPWVAPLVAPAVDLSIVGLLLGIRHLVLHGATAEQTRPARRLLVFASVVALALNVADPLIAGEFGRAAFDAVGPLLLIGWAEVGPGLLDAVSATVRASSVAASEVSRSETTALGDGATRAQRPESERAKSGSLHVEDGLLERARRADARHWMEHRRPMSTSVEW
ncbi:hypothetical protein [Amycolatopsis aidingensis]|uniref:hypothetical protein n=1 Tax=Amycolatopsis aidingensis TaxID=2842453 RepID=UPI001E596365|nr:hypothetical protein [Amycolatopsis aidingensis]